jgi:ABC-2 type transport system ATP-binding protein
VVLDDRVADAPLTGVLVCTVRLRRPDEAIAKALREWGFTEGDEGHEWSGKVAGADRLRFMGMLSRYVGLLVKVSLDEHAVAPALKVVS